jgi:serine/threonine-protein kinase
MQPGDWLNGQIRLLSWLGEEFFGESFMAEQRPMSRRVVVKFFKSAPFGSPDYLDRFRHTAERAMLLHHRHLASVHAFGVLDKPFVPPALRSGGEPSLAFGANATASASTGADGGIPWIATDPLSGVDLRSFLADGIAPAALQALLLPVADALDQAAALGLSHGELLPQNLYLEERPALPPHLWLVDLGVAKLLSRDPLDVPLSPQSLAYRSPEQCADGRACFPSSDRYALGIVLFEAVAGRPPFVSREPHTLLREHLTSPLPPLRTLLPNLRNAEALDAFFVRALAKQPEARFPSATALVEEFGRALHPVPKRVFREGARRRSPRLYRISRKDQPQHMVDVVVGVRAVLGKQSECEVVCQALPSPERDTLTAAISREHAVLVWLDDRLHVLDQSSHGTFVNDKRTGSRLWPLPDEAELRLGEHLQLQVRLVPKTPGATSPDREMAGVLLTRTDPYALGAPPTFLLWSPLETSASPVAEIGGPMRLGQWSVSQQELWWSGHPSVAWSRADKSLVLGAGPLRHGDVLRLGEIEVLVEH